MLGKDKATIKGAVSLLERVIEYYNNGFGVTTISIMTGLKEETVRVLVDIAQAVENESNNKKK